MKKRINKYIYRPPKPPKHFKFSDDVMFSYVMHDKGICKAVIETVVSQKIGKIVTLTPQEYQSASVNTKEIRLDISVETKSGELFDIEMQNRRNTPLKQRAIYYQSALVIKQLEKGVSYEELKDVNAIFLCKFDFFKMGDPLYFFQQYAKIIVGKRLVQ